MSSVVFLLWLIFRQINTEDVIVNSEVKSTIDLQNQVVLVRNIIEFSNDGYENLRNYLYPIEDANLPFVVTFYNKYGQELLFTQAFTEINNTLLFNVALEKVVKPGETYKLFCKILYANKIIPATKYRGLEEDQLLKYAGNLHFFSVYATRQNNVTITVSGDLIIVSPLPEEMITRNQIKYDFTDLKNHSRHPVEIIFIDNNPFLVVKELERIIRINHFGKIFIKETITIENNGPKLRGPYFNSVRALKKAATISWLYTHLPASAENIKFFDSIGNSSKTSIIRHFDYLTLKFKTRYPLLGGWKTCYTLQYEVPAHEYLYRKSKNRYLLKIRGVDHVLSEKVIEKASVKIALPEGGSLEKLTLPKSLSLWNEKVECFEGFCVAGHYTIELRGQDLFEIYDDVVVEYYYDSIFLFTAPVLFCFYVQGVFLVFYLGAKYFVF